jgi:hypothetical protein
MRRITFTAGLIYRTSLPASLLLLRQCYTQRNNSQKQGLAAGWASALWRLMPGGAVYGS